MTDNAPAQAERHDPFAALRFRDFRLLTTGRFTASLSEMMVSVAIGWELYERTGNAFALGLVGLVQVIPLFALALIAGHVADRFNRRKVLFITQIGLTACGLGLALLSATQRPLPLVYCVLLMMGVFGAFYSPATSTLLPQTVPPEAFHSAATWSSSAWQLAAVLGPALGGALIGLLNSATLIYVLYALGGAIFMVLVLLIKGREVKQSREPLTAQSLLAGFRFIRRTPVVMSAITLDMVAVLFGGATALLPVFAKDILQVRPEGLGWMRAAPSIGAVVMVGIIAYLPPFKRAGQTLLWAVAGFGLATIIFGLSTSFILSLAMLFLLGALDNISVVIRSTLLLTRTPDEMRGRVSAVNSVFIGASNELGAFESGMAAALLGPILAVVSGGIGTIIVVLAVARTWPELRRLGKLNEV
jgi:MFS family permease